MAFCRTPAPKLTSGFPVRTKVLQLPGSFDTFMMLLLAKSRTLSAWLKGHRFIGITSPHKSTISGQRGPVMPHPVALSVANSPHPVKGLRRSFARLNCGVWDTSKKRSAGHGHFQVHLCSVLLYGSNCWRKPVLTNSSCVPDRSMCLIFDHSAITLASPMTFRLAKSSSFKSFIFAKDFSSPNTAVFDRWRSLSSVALVKAARSPVTLMPLRSSSCNHFIFAKDFRSPNTALFDKWRRCRWVALAKAARSPVTSVPLRSSVYRWFALDKSSNRPATRVLRSSRYSNSVLFANTSTEPDTLLSSRTRLCNFHSFAISGCSQPPRSRPGNSILMTSKQLSFHLGRDIIEASWKAWQLSNKLFVTKSWTPFFVALPKGHGQIFKPFNTRKVAQVPLQIWFLHPQTSEHNLERFLLWARFSFIFIHIISNASSFDSTKQSKDWGDWRWPGNETRVSCFRFVGGNVLTQKMWQYQCAPTWQKFRQ